MQARSRDLDASYRLKAVDALRGLIIVLMALDHANYFVAQKHSPGEYWGGPFPVYSQPLPFLTRLVTHLAAPGFFFLMGVGMALYATRYTRSGQSRRQIMGHFWIRGTLLIALQFLIVNRAWELSPGGWGPDVYAGVLFALGGTMILSSLLLWLEPRYLFLLAGLLLIGMELVHPDPSAWNETELTVVQRLFVHPGGDTNLWSNYPIFAWLEVAVFGLAYGRLLAHDPEPTYRRGAFLGAGFLLLFVFVRAANGFGNIRPRPGASWIDFLNLVKYPPSIAFSLSTVGVNLILLWLFNLIAEKHHRLLRPLTVYGRAPLFFYVLHLFLYVGLGLLFVPGGTTIPAMIPYWLLGLVILYPLCLWFARFKRRQAPGSVLRYF